MRKKTTARKSHGKVGDRLRHVLGAKVPDVQKWLPVVAAAESANAKDQKMLDWLSHWASVVDCV